MNNILKGKALVAEVRQRAEEKRLELDMTCRMQLRDDCKAVEKCIQQIDAGKHVEKNNEELELAIIRLKTTAEALLDIKDNLSLIDIHNSFYAQKAMNLFKEGYNCAQAVFLAFEDLCHLDRKNALMLSSSFGGGMGRLREVCGAVSGMFMVAGVLYGYDSPEAFDEKAEHYARIQELAKAFRDANGSIVCRELLGINEETTHVPEKRTQSYYQKRPCAELVGQAAAILEQYIEKRSLYE